ncbi:Misato segment II tubulin-like domain-containing protein [Dunaliella salina]|uniref:Misato segment II tubulin-like domain-containing protein n=1 Tax=Dunaliella salina TaxID=3046 RepID=A0ABQ7G0I4_DUNSA|nr:Misato segment II tubulin-like domain-containing protein [Dunaliella salina]|eukprot:KAF5828118.1 Misato segment II tubulin-like domain-containing protein [Dunaliella salina]
MPHELITLQLGNYANYVGTHFWNLQDELIGFSGREDWWRYTAAVDSDVLYAAGEDRQGQLTYRPRALFVDLSGSLGGVRFAEDGSSAPAASASTLSEGAGISTWGGRLEVHQAEATPKSRFVQELEAQAELSQEDYEDEAAADARQASLEEAAAELNAHPQGQTLQEPSGTAGPPAGVNYWTDYLKAVLAPKSVYTLPGMWHGSTSFSGFGDGSGLLGGTDGAEIREELSERVRNLGEACDQLQGFQMLVDDLSGFGGVATYLAEEITQEYGGSTRPLMLFALRPPEVAAHCAHDGLSRMRRGLNEGMAATLLAEHCQLYVPAAPPLHPPSHLVFPPSSCFHTSALLAAALDTAIMPVRTAGSAASPLGPPIGASNLHSLVKLLQGHGRGGQNLTYLGLALPAPHVPADMQRLGELTDTRISHPHGPGSVAAAANTPEGHFSSQAVPGQQQDDWPDLPEGGPDSWSMPLTEGVQNTAGACLAQSTTLRGPRTVYGPASCSTAHTELLALLQRGPQRRCVQHHCIHPLPLLLPLPFPRMFTHAVGLNGDLNSSDTGLRHRQALSQPQGSTAAAPAAASTHTARLAPDVRTAPVMTQLAASSEFEGYLNKVAQNWRQAASSSIGQTMLEGWGVSKSDVTETEETLLQAASTYVEGESDTEL